MPRRGWRKHRLVPSRAVAKKSRTPAPPRPVQAPKRRDAPRSAAPTARSNRLWLIVGAVLALAAIGAVIAVLLTRGGGNGTSAQAPIDWASVGNLHTGPPPWDNGSAYLPDRLSTLGLSQLSSEGSVLHIHNHLDVYVNGKKVTVPEGIGAYASAWLTEIHTHTTDGIVHVESPSKQDFRLGQVFGEWGVKLTASCVGSSCGAKQLHWWVNGKPMTGDPAQLVLKAHQEIVVAHGTPPTVVPKTYKFAPGE